MSGAPLAVAAVAVACLLAACLLAGWLAGRTEGDSVAWWEVSEAQRLLAEERDRADELAEAVRDLLYGGTFLGSTRTVDYAVLALRAHDGARSARKYHHVGTGRTESIYFCATCDGFYGVPHDGDTHEHTRKRDFRRGCACRPCQEFFGIYPSEGVFL